MNRPHTDLDYSFLSKAVMSPITRRVLLLPPLVAGLAACASTTPSPCRSCDAGQPDLVADRPRDGWATEASPAGEVASEVAPLAADASPEGPPATRDTPPGEAPRLTPIPDA